jgi:anion-transporting  ArsA/GET3 family ATPase
MAAALALLAARARKRVLTVDVDAKGDLAGALGSHPVGFEPHTVQPGVWSLRLQPEQAFQEYLRIYFKVPRFARLTPLAHVFDFIATGVPGPRDMLVVGKIAYEQRRRQGNGKPMWDLIIVDSAASGQMVSHLAAASNMLTLVRGGIIHGQVEWIDEMVRDHERTTVVLCALPQEMAVVEAIELYHRLQDEVGVAVDVCLLNQVITASVTPAQRKLVTAMSDASHRDEVAQRLGGPPEPLGLALDLAARLHQNGREREKELVAGLPIPVVEVPLTVARPGLATTRHVADALEAGLS